MVDLVDRNDDYNYTPVVLPIVGDVEEVGDETRAAKVDIGEARAVHYRKTPRAPTAEEIAAHYVSHIPHRDWCPVCVAG
eukprot:12921896-Prorocentrum_lima.AAC.1